MFGLGKVEERKQEERIKTTNCFDCGVKLLMTEAKTNPNPDGDKRFFCEEHFKSRFGKKKKLIRRV